MTASLSTESAGRIVPPAQGIVLDSEDARRERDRRLRRINTRTVPALRVLGGTLLIVGVLLYDAVLIGSVDWSVHLRYSLFIFGYVLIAWLVLRRWYSPNARIDLSLVFLVLDLVPLGVTVYVTGADSSWVFWVFLFRVGDQTWSYFRRALVFTHLAALSYLAVVGYVAFVEGRPVSWPPEIAKAGFLYLGALYMSTTALTSERIRNQLRNAIYLARESVARLSEKSAELERARRQAESASRAKSEFLSRVSHELRTPMNAILGFAQLLDMEDLTPDQRANVDEILEGGRHLLDIINEVLDIARVETGALARELEPVSLSAAVADVLAAARPAAAARKVTLPAEVPASCDVLVLAHERKLRQVLEHLVSNAVRYNSSPGSVEVACEEREDRVRVLISDTGPGIPADALEAAFTPFVRLDAEGEDADGTGLGLPLARALVQGMGGSLDVEPRPGGGSTFWFELTRPGSGVGGEESTESGKGRRAEPRSGALVLYIDDKPENIALVRRILARRPGIELITASVGREGLELARARNPDLVLLDLELPDVPGRDILLRLRADPETRGIPVVVVSAEAAPSTVRRLLADGARAYLTMPYDVAEFLVTLDGLLSPSE